MNVERRTLNIERWTLDVGRWALDDEALDDEALDDEALDDGRSGVGCWTLEIGGCTLDTLETLDVVGRRWTSLDVVGLPTTLWCYALDAGRSHV